LANIISSSNPASVMLQAHDSIEIGYYCFYLFRCTSCRWEYLPPCPPTEIDGSLEDNREDYYNCHYCYICTII